MAIPLHAHIYPPFAFIHTQVRDILYLCVLIAMNGYHYYPWIYSNVYSVCVCVFTEVDTNAPLTAAPHLQTHCDEYNIVYAKRKILHTILDTRIFI